MTTVHTKSKHVGIVLVYEVDQEEFQRDLTEKREEGFETVEVMVKLDGEKREMTFEEFKRRLLD